MADGPTATHRHPWAVLFGPWSVAVAAVIVVGATLGARLLVATTGGVQLCWFLAVSGLPCPGCGLTRSVMAAARGELAAAVMLHPFGPLILLWAIAATASPLLRGERRRRLVAAFGRSHQGFSRAYGVLVATFVAFGVLRVATVLVER